MESKIPAVWPPYEAFYVEAMLFNCRAALASAEDVSRVVEALQHDDFCVEDIETNGFLDSLHSLVIHAGMLARYFWPSRDKTPHRERAEHLRARFDVEGLAGLKDKNLRNFLEHLDEKLDVYLEGGIVGHILPAFAGFESDRSGVQTHFFRAYFIDSGIFETLGHRFKIQPILDDITHVHEKLESASSKGKVRE